MSSPTGRKEEEETQGCGSSWWTLSPLHNPGPSACANLLIGCEERSNRVMTCSFTSSSFFLITLITLRSSTSLFDHVPSWLSQLLFCIPLWLSHISSLLDWSQLSPSHLLASDLHLSNLLHFRSSHHTQTLSINPSFIPLRFIPSNSFHYSFCPSLPPLYPSNASVAVLPSSIPAFPYSLPPSLSWLSITRCLPVFVSLNFQEFISGGSVAFRSR